MTQPLVLADLGTALAGLIGTVVWVVSVAIFVYVMIDLARSFIGEMPPVLNAVHDALGTVCEPLFAPIRRVLPPTGGIDFSPLVTLILIAVVGRFVVDLLL